MNRYLTVPAMAGVLVAALVAPAFAAPQTPKPKPTLTLHVSDRSLLVGSPVTVAGRASKGSVLVTRYKGVSSTRRLAAGRFQRTVKPGQGKTTFFLKNGRYRSRTVRVQTNPVTTCTPLKDPTDEAVWTDLSTVGSQLAKNIAALICSAADGATIDIKSWFIEPGDPDTDLILADLALMHTYHHVTVNVLIGQQIYEVSSSLNWDKATAALRTFATLSSCYRGCVSSDPAAIPHSKWMTVSATRWGPPAVLSTSANWTREQWRGTRESGLYLYDDQPLYAALVTHFNAMVACGSGTCPTPDIVTGWVPDGDGNALYLAPQPTDGLVDALSNLTCVPGGEIDGMSLFLHDAALTNQLSRLQSEGCAIHLLLEHPPAQGLIESFAPMCRIQHDKGLIIDTGAGVSEAVFGSQDFSVNAAALSDNAMIASTSPEIVAQYRTFFTQASAGESPCVSAPTPSVAVAEATDG
ncbi:MAG TPA: hypothetical protein VHW92_11180 [Mycobacteriales bacterium]|nr:hypothetical protein [Mycobacteriales bacterium]